MHFTKEEIIYRPMEKHGVCRGCDNDLPKGTKVIATYSRRNRGYWIFLCKDCINTMKKLVDDDS